MRRPVAGLEAGFVVVLFGLWGESAPGPVATESAFDSASKQPEFVGIGQAGFGFQQARIFMEADTTLIHVGDPVSVRLRVSHPPGWSVRWPDSVDVAPFEVLRYETGQTGADGDRRGSSAEVIITSFELGEMDIPPIEVLAEAPDGSAQTLITDPFRIGVESVGLDESGEIRGIKGPLSVPRSWWGPALWLALLGTATGGLALAWRRLRRRTAPEIAAPPPSPPRPFHLVALEALDALGSSNLLEQGRIKKYHVRVSEIIRTYVEGQLQVPAREMTTGEVVNGLRRAALGDKITEKFRIFLESCDLVKFAKVRPSYGDSRVTLVWARELVELTSSSRPPSTTGANGDSGADNPAPPGSTEAATLEATRDSPGSPSSTPTGTGPAHRTEVRTSAPRPGPAGDGAAPTPNADDPPSPTHSYSARPISFGSAGDSP